MAGTITVRRISNACGKYSDMTITITDVTGKQTIGSVADGEQQTFNVVDGDYTVSVKLGVPSIGQNVTISDSAITLDATVISKTKQVGHSIPIGIDKIVLK